MPDPHSLRAEKKLFRFRPPPAEKPSVLEFVPVPDPSLLHEDSLFHRIHPPFFGSPPRLPSYSFFMEEVWHGEKVRINAPGGRKSYYSAEVGLSDFIRLFSLR